MKTISFYKRASSKRFFHLLLIYFISLAGNGQIVSIAEANLKITFPGNDWQGGLHNFPGTEGGEQMNGITSYIYEKNTKTPSSEKKIKGLEDILGTVEDRKKMPPRILIFIDNKAINKTAAGYSDEKTRLESMTIIKTYTVKSPASPVPNLSQVVVHKFIQEIPIPLIGPLTQKGYVAYIVNQKKGVTIAFLVSEDEFDKYDKEVAGIFRSIISTASTTAEVPANQPAAKPVNVCDYIPLKNKMSYKYLETNSNPGAFGELGKLFGGGSSKTFAEEYTFVSNKTVAGKLFKGYRLKSNDQAKNGNTFYYNCSNNDERMHTEIYEWEDKLAGHEYMNDIYIGPVYDKVFKPTGRYTTIFELKGSIPIGEIWTETEFVNGNELKVSTSIEETGLKLEVNEEMYTDVIKVVRTATQNTGAGSVAMQSEVYYAKGIGKIKIVNTMATLMGVSTNTLELISYTVE